MSRSSSNRDGILNCVVHNPQSLNNKVTYVMDIFKQHNVDVAFLSETWLENSNNNVTATIKQCSYNIYHSNQFGRCKGVALLLHSKLKPTKVLPLSNYTTFDAALVYMPRKLFRANCNIVFISFYRYQGWGRVFDNFITEFTDFISSLIITDTSFLICRDFNIRWNKANDIETIKFRDVLEEYNMHHNIPGVPTHVRGNTIDFIISDLILHPFISFQSCSHYPHAGDHFPMFFTISTLNNSSNSKFVKKRNF